MSLTYADHRQDPVAWARALDVSAEAIGLYLQSDVVDLHIDSYIWTRLFRYDLAKRHGHGPFGARFFSQVDLPRIREARITGGIWSITTNPLWPQAWRRRVFEQNLRGLTQVLGGLPDDVVLAKRYADYVAAKAAGKHAAFIGIQGGNALDADLSALDAAGDSVLRVTLVHLSSSSLGVTSSPLAGGADDRLTDFGHDYVRRLNAKRIFVDLAHISRRGFFDAVAAHDKSQPLIVTHTGVAGVHRHWRNLDDAQIKAIADTGGTVGVMYQSSFLGDSLLGGRAVSIVRHLEHIIAVAGEDFASLGSDWDGMIIPPRDMPTCLELPRLVQIMLDRGWKPERTQKVLGANFLRALKLLRP